jgi:type IV pilus assembly protein PilA
MDNPMKQTKGFTVIELMAIVAIISILAVLALGAYQDYVLRAKVGEGLAFTAEAKTSVSEYYASNREMPISNADAGLPTVLQYQQNGYNYVNFLEITASPASGTIVINFKIPGSPADNKVLLLVPDTMTDGTVRWDCLPAADATGIDIKYVPANCRG